VAGWGDWRVAGWGVRRAAGRGDSTVTVYAIAQMSIRDRARYDRYAAAFLPVLAKYGGRLLVADEHPALVEGQWSGEKVVLIEFPDRGTFTTWANSPEYQEISKDRLAATDGVVVLVRGLAQPTR
jgi:uncharacterized protein (DUF1330 family)